MPLRIAQLSDLHLTASDTARPWGSDAWANLNRVLGALEEGPRRPDLLVLTGDVANRPRPGVYARLRQRLEPWRDRLCVIPGNHDGRAMLREAFAGHAVPGRPTMNFSRELCGWKLLGLDSLRWPFVHGKLGREQIDWLSRELAGSDLPALLFVHHPPVRVGTWWLDKDRLRDRAGLAPVLRDSNARGLACGHVHQVTEDTFAGVRVWTCPSTAYQFAPRTRWPGTASRKPAYRIFELDGEDLRTEISGA